MKFINPNSMNPPKKGPDMNDCERTMYPEHSDSSDSSSDEEYFPSETEEEKEEKIEKKKEKKKEGEKTPRHVSKKRRTLEGAKKLYKKKRKEKPKRKKKKKRSKQKQEVSLEPKKKIPSFEDFIAGISQIMSEKVVQKVEKKLLEEEDTSDYHEPSKKENKITLKEEQQKLLSKLERREKEDDEEEKTGIILFISTNNSEEPDNEPSKPDKKKIVEKVKTREHNLRPKKDYRDTLTPEEKARLEDTEKKVQEFNRSKIPPRVKVMLSPMSLASKAKVIQSMERLNWMSHYSSEYSKLSQWVDTALKIPFGTFCQLPVTLNSPKTEIDQYFQRIEKTMNNCIYGQKKAKEAILECVGNWITNPQSSHVPLAFVGEKGTGKTTLAKEGISKALGRPFFIISLGGESDAASFKGHDYTYEGSRWGKIVDCLIQAKAMNPIILFDELDKLSSTRAGQEIESLLIHLTDRTQNNKFYDKYFSGIDIDLSRCLFIFSYNYPQQLNPILRDRLYEIEFDKFNLSDKIKIAKQFLIPKACQKVGFIPNRYYLSDQTIEVLINRFSQGESGVRTIKKAIETLFLRLNLSQLPQSLDISYKGIQLTQRKNKNHITTSTALKVLKTFKSDNELPISVRHIYT